MTPRRLLIALNILLSSVGGFANISEGPVPPVGQVTGAPFISKHCTITSELLKVDLRPLENLQDAVVSAQYNFVCDTSNDALNLIFVARNLSGKNFKITLDGIDVKGDTITIGQPPEHWLVPRPLPWRGNYYGWSETGLVYDSTGWSDAQRYHDWHERFIDYISFNISVDSGIHSLLVLYDVDVPQSYSGKLISHCFSYILSPAKDWKSYTDLNMELYVPEGWSVESNLKLSGSTDSYTGYWRDLPSDYFYVITMMPSENFDLVIYVYLWGGWLLLIAILVWRLKSFTKRFNNGDISRGIYWTIPLWLMPLGVIFFFTIYAWRDVWLMMWYGAQLDPGITHGDSYTWIFGFIPLTLLGVGAAYAFQGILLAFFKRKI